MIEESEMERIDRLSAERAARLVEAAKANPAAAATLTPDPPEGIVFEAIS